MGYQWLQPSRQFASRGHAFSRGSLNLHHLPPRLLIFAWPVLPVTSSFSTPGVIPSTVTCCSDGARDSPLQVLSVAGFLYLCSNDGILTIKIQFENTVTLVPSSTGQQRDRSQKKLKRGTSGGKKKSKRKWSILQVPKRRPKIKYKF